MKSWPLQEWNGPEHYYIKENKPEYEIFYDMHNLALMCGLWNWKNDQAKGGADLQGREVKTWNAFDMKDEGNIMGEVGK